MEVLQSLLNSFDLSPITVVVNDIATTLAKSLSPILLVLAIYIRLMETQLDGLASGSGKYTEALRDMLIWTFVLGSYFAICTLVLNFMNPIYAALEKTGSVQSTMASYEMLSRHIAELVKKQSLLDAAIAAAAIPYVAVSALFYYATLLFLIFLTLFLKIANVMVFGVAFIWGLIAIPMAISNKLSLLRGWAYLYAFSLVWPVIQGLLLSMVVASMMADTANNSNAALLSADAKMLFTVMHLLIAAVMIAAPFIANALITNSSAAGGIISPFVAAAMAAGAATTKTIKTGMSSSFKPPSASPSGAQVKSLSQGPIPRASSQALVEQGAQGGGARDITPPVTPMPGVDPTQQQKAQRRRGVIIRQQNKGK
jgi:hypothetical protein